MEIIKKILIVGNRRENILALERILEGSDFQIISALSGNVALAKTIEHEFALALIDVEMPEMNGYEIVDLLRQVEKTKFLPVIFLLDIYSEDHFKVQAIEAGAVDFITKPFLPQVLLGKIKIFLDLYEQKKLLEIEVEHCRQIELSLCEAKIKAEASDKLKTAFIANMSHEIRTPLTTIVGFSSLLSEVDLPKEKKVEFARYVQRSSEGLINIISDILDIAKIESGQIEIHKAPVNVRTFLAELFNIFKEKMNKKGKEHLKLILSIPEDIPETLFTDEIRLKQIISNLLSNAAKFTVEGSIELGCRVSGNSIDFFVVDTGVGVPEDKLDVIFERFQKAENEKIRNPSGTGLGLSIVKKLAELLQGSVKVQSILDQGSQFTLSIPLILSSELRKEKKEFTPSELDWSSKSIMIVEDEYTTFVLLESLLTPTKAKLTWAKNGREALDAFFCNNNFDAILLDINMPVMNGIEAYKEFRKFDQHLPIIAQTAYAMAEDRNKFKAMGFDGYIPKPIIKLDLFNQLNFLLG